MPSVKDDVESVQNSKDARCVESNIVYKGRSTQIRRHLISKQDENYVDFIDGCQAIGKKVAIKSLSPCPSQEDLACLNNEYNILSRYLVNCATSTRKVLGRSKTNGLAGKKICDENDSGVLKLSAEAYHATPAIYLEWLEGITLQDLIEDWRSRENTSAYETLHPIDNLCVVHLMYRIALALADIHEAGVIHNDIATDNIIISFQNEDSETKVNGVSLIPESTKIIDFGYATTFAMAEANDSGETVNDDLYSLGAVYRDILISVSPSDGSRTFLSRTSISHMSDEVLSGSVPASIRGIISCLTYSNGDTDSLYNPPYKSGKEVAEDLEQMINDPDEFLYDLHGENNGNPILIFNPSRLYGRSREVEKLLNEYKEINLPSAIGHGENSKCPSIVLISGYGGSGKTALAQSLKENVIKSGGHFVSGKFDALQRNTPFSALIKALSELCVAILAKDGEGTIGVIRENIVKAVGSEDMILIKLIPNLDAIIYGTYKKKEKDQNVGAENQSMFADGMRAQNKLSFVFRRFMRAVATSDHPLVIVLDDLQWADTASLNLLQSIVTDSENSSPLLIIGCYRNNELGDNHPLLETIDNIERLKYSSCKKKIDVINVDNLDRESINEMISDVLRTKRRVTRKTLANIVYQKTSGNPLFTVQFLKSLVEDNLLWTESKQWRWDVEGICQKNVSNGVVEILAHKIETRLSENARNVLKVAACFGSTFEVKILAMVFNSKAEEVPLIESDPLQIKTELNHIVAKGDDLSKLLGDLADDGFIEETGSKLQYKFAHDRVQQAAYSCFPDVERTVMHYRIGRIMQKKLAFHSLDQDLATSNDSLLYTLADQMNRGSALISNGSEKISLAKINLMVGENCIRKSSYETAVIYLEAGIRLLDDDSCWQEHYSLAIHLYNITAEAKYSTGNFEAIQVLLDKVHMNAKCFEDKVSAYLTQMLVMGAQGKADESIKIGLSALNIMGEKFPNSISKRAVVLDVMRTKWMLKKRNESILLGLPLMTDRGKIRVMQLLSALVMYCGAHNYTLLALVANRMIRISALHGLCESSSFAFAVFSFLICSKFGDKKSGRRYGQLSLSIMKKCGGKEWSAKLYFILAGIVDYWMVDPLLGHDSLLDGHKSGMEVGDLEYASMCATFSMRNSFFDGESLVPFEKKSRMFCHQFAEYNQEFSLRLCVPLWQAVLNLLGKSENPEKLSGEAIDFGAHLNRETHDMTELHQASILFFEFYVAYLFGRNQLAAEKSEKARDLFFHQNFPRFMHLFKYYDTLNSISMANLTNERNWKVKAGKKKKEMKKLAKKLPQHYCHKYSLIRAKYAMLQGQRKRAAKRFIDAIDGARKAGLRNDEALAYEEAGIFFFKVGKEQQSRQYFANAHQCYLKWGAKGKADHLYNCWMTE